MSDLAISSLNISKPYRAKQAEVNTCHPEEEAHFEGTTSALDNVIGRSEPDSILAFGYTHRETEGQPSAVEIFAWEVVPYLASIGYTDLVLEVFPRDETGDVIEVEIEEFNETGIVGVEMNRFLNLVDRPNFELLLRQAYASGVNIHSGGLDRDNIFQTIWYPNFALYPERLEVARQEIARNSGDRISSLAAAGQRVFSLNGTVHNDLYPSPRNETASFGGSINSLFPSRFVEIDMVIPELSERHDYYTDLPLSDECSWRSFIPDAGVNLISERGPNSYLIFWPIADRQYSRPELDVFEE
ncbi:hypothetical protein A3H38_01525 [candidate division WOR-1 bacterium RIFCSPLOWO2_02_FULL_46_20]|uniref:Haem-binding uptake Tiki superfamily ChaN domain-containing protein n=2 Tax=Saganbacteria TaxID=1703751 RepID=A0A1F4RDG1_UNCSA|nr:MAG: hypothetical protein A3J44_06825 [candidate division WOR-1 bacterium RIFCSPHIGHO2_02_FULL_45_12]OGC06221.1 MAG: hypothetical protein A3H38_01525 [candidate division WOR-1 bacterium RIFCSPLOWO2_02_FULL_46_20]